LLSAIQAANRTSLSTTARLYPAYGQLGIASYNLKNWCEAVASWDMTKESEHKFPDSLERFYDQAQAHLSAQMPSN
tara:strand:+ start:245 stop:472 length:228 start_codon:yes stop_codon:yes gene_type:complete